MKRKFINKLVVGAVISTTLCTLVPIRASAEWVNDYQGNWYYMQDNQRMTGWKRIDGQLYYFNENGKMQTGWIKAGDSWYFLQNNGILKTGWVNYNKKWYYADSSGAIQTGIINVSGKVYIFDSNGAMKTSNTFVNGEFYTIDANGEVAGLKVPTPDKEFDNSGNCIQVIKNTSNKVNTNPISTSFNEVVSDQSTSNDDPNIGRIFKVILKDTNGAELNSKNVKYGKSIDLYEPDKVKYIFTGWNTKSDGSGKSYAADDSIKVKEDITLYAQWSEDTAVFVDGITIKGSAYVTVNKTVQMTAEVSPNDAANKGVTWTVTNGTGEATIDSNGLLTGVKAGTVTVKATAKDGTNISATKEVTVSVSDVVTPINKITVNSKTGSYSISTDKGTLQMVPNVLPNDATNQNVKWTIEDGGTGSASISDTGLVTAISNGAITVVATAMDNSGVSGKRTITITGQSTKVPVEGVSVSGKTGNKIIDDGGTLQMIANVSPSNATNKSVTWKVENGSGKATISTTGLLTALSNGTVTVKAISTEDSSIIGSIPVDINGQTQKVENIDVTSGTDVINVDNQTLQMSAVVSPNSAIDQSIIWSVEQYGDPGTTMTGKATISSTGVLTPIADGTVTVKATSKKVPTVFGTKTITIKNQSIKATGLEITPKDVKELATSEGAKPELQLDVIITPSNATNTTAGAVKWDVKGITGAAEFVQGKVGLLRALKNGTVLVTATTTDGSNISVSKAITISGMITDITTASIVGENNETEIKTNQGTLQMNLIINPTDAASNRTVAWSVDSIADSYGVPTTKTLATITGAGMLKAVDNGTVTVKADIQYRKVALNADGSVQRDTTGSAVFITINKQVTTTIKISGQPVYITDIIVNSDTGSTSVPVGGTLKMVAAINPSNATNKDIAWSYISKGGDISLDPDGQIKGKTAGDVVVKATALDGSGKIGERTITVTP